MIVFVFKYLHVSTCILLVYLRTRVCSGISLAAHSPPKMPTLFHKQHTPFLRCHLSDAHTLLICKLELKYCAVTASDTVPTTSWSSEQETLIQSGHMTPFGTSDPHTTPTKAKDDEVKVSDKSNNETPGLRLCSEGFDGLFESQSSVVPLKKKGVSPLGAQRKGKERKRSIGHHSVRESDDVRSEIGGGGERSDGALGEDVRGVDGEEEVGEGWMPTREEVEEMEREMMEEKNDWQEEEEEDGSTEYSTDEELGAGTHTLYSIHL